MSDNPYQAPSADLTTNNQQRYDDSSIFSISGRLGRLNFAAYSVGMFAALCIFSLIFILVLFVADENDSLIDFSGPAAIGLSILLAIGCLFFVAFSVILSVKRFHDFDASGWWYLISFVPYVGSAVGIFLMLKGGDEYENRFGYPPAPPSPTAKWILGLSILIITVCFVLLFATIPMDA